MEKYNYIMEKIKKLNIPFKIKGIEKFSMNGITNETVILEYENSEFVFVEGKNNITLGWDIEKCNIGKNVIECFKKYYYDELDYLKEQKKDLIEYYNEKIKKAEQEEDINKINNLKEDMEEEINSIYPEEYKDMTVDGFMDSAYSVIKNCVSPLRTVNIGSMIVERDSMYLNRNMSYNELKEEINKSPFSIPTEDEWEYLCGGGTRTFFRWGDSLEKVLDEIFNIESVQNKKEDEILCAPNMFGLYINYDSYKYEIIDDENYIKSGDGGCSICGGDGIIYSAPIFSTFYRHNFKNKIKMSEYYYSYRRIIRL